MKKEGKREDDAETGLEDEDGGGCGEERGGGGLSWMR